MREADSRRTNDEVNDEGADRPGRTSWVPVHLLRPADSPRSDGEDPEHVRVLATVETRLPPIVVHRASHRVIDGMHRLAAAKLRGDAMIEVRYFEGTEHEAFVLAVKANTTHGRPLTMSDRARAAERIIVSHPGWSDRSIAVATGIGARQVADVRRRLETRLDPTDRPRSRIGRDGRVRPLDGAAGRLKAAEVIREFPAASLREIGSRAGISPATARDVRARIQRGDDPVPGPRAGTGEHRPVRPSAPAAPGVTPAAGGADLAVMLRGLRLDPSLRFSDAGRDLLRWLMVKVPSPEQWNDLSRTLPPHTTYLLADIARECAQEWHRIAEDLDRRLRPSA
jgi:ParB-like chromosome segregation protein Spo0J